MKGCLSWALIIILLLLAVVVWGQIVGVKLGLIAIASS
jgi:hypothetical protein